MNSLIFSIQKRIYFQILFVFIRQVIEFKSDVFQEEINLLFIQAVEKDIFLPRFMLNRFVLIILSIVQ